MAASARLPRSLTIANLLVAVAMAAQTLHIGMLDQRTGSLTSTYMRPKDMYFDWLATTQDNTIGGVKFDFVIHNVDGRSDVDIAPQLAVDFWKGNWTRTYFTPENGYHDEPEQHPLDVMFVSWSSKMIPRYYQGLKDAGVDIPIYTMSSTGTGAWYKDADMFGEGRWDFSTTASSMSDTEAFEILKFLKNSGAETIVIAEEGGAGAYTEALARGARRAAGELGIEILADEKFEWPCKKATPEDGCEEENFQVLENAFGSIVKRGKRTITASVWFGAFYAYACPHELRWFEKRNINFGAYIVTLCADSDTMREHNEHRHDFVIGPSGWHRSIKSNLFDERYSPVQMFAEAGPASAAAFDDAYKARYGESPSYPHALVLAGIYYFHYDMVTVNGDHTKLREHMKKWRSPIPSLFGLLGTGEGGVNVFHNFIGGQVFPDGTNRVVAPAHLATDQGIYPCPTWYERDCWPSCVPCQLCHEIVEATPIVMTTIIGPFFLGMIVVAYWHIVLDFKPRNIWVDVPRCSFILMNVASDVMAVLVMNAMMEEDLLDVTNEYMAVLTIYVIFTIASVWCSLVRLKWLWIVITKNVKTAGERGSVASSTIFACRQELAVTCISCIVCDIPIFIIQTIMLTYVMHQELTVSIPLIASMIFSGVTIGSVTTSTVEFELYKIISQYSKTETNIAWTDAMMLVVNPFYTRQLEPKSSVAVEPASS